MWLPVTTEHMSSTTDTRIRLRVGRTETPAQVELEEAAEEAFNELDFREYFGFIANEELVVVRPYLGDEDDRVLEELRPKYVILFDPNPAFVRRIEVSPCSACSPGMRLNSDPAPQAYRAAHQNLAIRVYFLVYKDSVEEQRYLSEIRREKDSFVRLIEEKGVSRCSTGPMTFPSWCQLTRRRSQSMAIPHEAEYRPGDEQPDLLRTVNTRIGGKKALSETPKVRVTSEDVCSRAEPRR